MFNAVEVGRCMHGEVNLTVDSRDYDESLTEQEGVPPLVYEWQLVGIEMCINRKTADQQESAVDSSEEQFSAIERIDCVKDRRNGSTGGYILHCELLDSQPERDTYKPLVRFEAQLDALPDHQSDNIVFIQNKDIEYDTDN
jgi:hypothetical protein